MTAVYYPHTYQSEQFGELVELWILHALEEETDSEQRGRGLDILNTYRGHAALRGNNERVEALLWVPVEELDDAAYTHHESPMGMPRLTKLWLDFALTPEEFQEALLLEEWEWNPTYEPAPLLCLDCQVDTVGVLNEYFMVQFPLWDALITAEDPVRDQFLCVGCMETRLGRRLVREDFITAPVNCHGDHSARLLDRMGGYPIRWRKEAWEQFKRTKRWSSDWAEESEATSP